MCDRDELILIQDRQIAEHKHRAEKAEEELAALKKWKKNVELTLRMHHSAALDTIKYSLEDMEP